MAEQTNLKSMNEYIERLTALSAQAQSDGRTHVSDIIKNIFCHVSQDMELMDFIYKSSDEFTEAMTDVYVFLLKNRFSTDWYKLVSFINEEKQSDTDAYYRTLYDCKPDMDIMRVREILENSLSPEQFASGIRDILPANRISDVAFESVPDDSARKENERLKAREAELLAELSEARNETARANQELMFGRKTAMESKLEADRLRKAASADKTAMLLLEKKIAKCSAMATDAEAINDMLVSTNKKLECELSNSSAQISQLNSEIAILQSQLREKSFQLEAVVTELDKMKESSRQSFVPEATPCKEEFTYSAPQAIREETEEPEGFEEEHDSDDIPDYDTSAVIPIRNNKEEVVKHTNLLTKIFSKYQDRKFQKKTKAEQENLIFIKTMEMSVSKPKMQMIKTAFNSNVEFSRLELYKLISANASEEELAMFLGCKVPSQ